MTRRNEETLRRHLGKSNPYSEEHWVEIKRTLANAGTNSALLDVSLRTKLNILAASFVQSSRSKYLANARKPPSLKEQTTELRKQIAELETTIKVLNEYATIYFIGPKFIDLIKAEREIGRRRAIKTLHRAQWPLIRCRDRLKAQLDRLTAAKGSNVPTIRAANRNAGQIYIEYWKELSRLWLSVVPCAVGLRHKHSHLRAFLRACSEPIFRSATTDNALRAFTDRYLPQSSSQTSDF
jgi:hypothetical protein